MENALDALKRSVARVVIDPLKNSKPNLYAIIPPIYMALENNIDRWEVFQSVLTPHMLRLSSAL